MKRISLETVILAHKFTCPYYSPESMNKGLPRPNSCGASDLHHQKDCNGECWYMSHFKELLNELQNKPLE